MIDIRIPNYLEEACDGKSDRLEWLDTLPDVVNDLADKWNLTNLNTFDADGSASWVIFCKRGESDVVLKLGMPHFEADDEIKALRIFGGNPTVRLLEADEKKNVLLLERCKPGTTQRSLPEDQQDEILSMVLPKIWDTQYKTQSFRSLSLMIDSWINDAKGNTKMDQILVERGANLAKDLLRTTERESLLATDLHAGNVLKSSRKEWLVIDPKPFVGDRAYDATQHLLNCKHRLLNDPLALIKRYSELLDLDVKRVQEWLYVRLAIHKFFEGEDQNRILLAIDPSDLEVE